MARAAQGLKVLLVIVAVLLVADLAVTGLVGAGALDPKRFTVGGDDDKPLVVSSTTVLDDLVLRVAGDQVRRELLVGPGGDPHSYEPTPRDQIAVEGARLIILNGYGLEPKIERMVESVRRSDQHVVEAAAGLSPHYEDDARTVPDPHMWMSIPLVKTYVANVRDALIAIDRTNADLYRANANAYVDELDLVDARIRALLDTIPSENRKLVTTHDAFRYFANEYDLDVIDTVWGVTTDAEPTADAVREMVERLRSFRVPAVFVEDSVNPKLLEAAAAEAGVRVGGSLYSDSLGLPRSGAHTYTSMMLRNAHTLAEGLGGDAT